MLITNEILYQFLIFDVDLLLLHTEADPSTVYDSEVGAHVLYIINSTNAIFVEVDFFTVHLNYSQYKEVHVE